MRLKRAFCSGYRGTIVKTLSFAPHMIGLCPVSALRQHKWLHALACLVLVVQLLVPTAHAQARGEYGGLVCAPSGTLSADAIAAAEAWAKLVAGADETPAGSSASSCPLCVLAHSTASAAPDVPVFFTNAAPVYAPAARGGPAAAALNGAPIGQRAPPVLS